MKSVSGGRIAKMGEDILKFGGESSCKTIPWTSRNKEGL
jgi:hypothetical protein